MPQLPNKPDYLRVKLRRRLGRLGAVAVRGSVYALPYTADAVEDFAWLRREIMREGGDAIVATVKLLEGISNDALAELFRQDCNARYAEIAEEAREAGEDARKDALPRLRRRMEAVVEIDYFNADGRETAEAALRSLDGRSREADELTAVETVQNIGSSRTWVTRRGPKVDRIASAWLVRRFIDPDARFSFVDPQSYEHEPGELRFDMFDGEFTHEGDRCTFETLLSRFGLREAALHVLAEIVHDIDVKDARYGRAETAGVAALINGLVAAHHVDLERIERGFVVFDSLYESLARA